MKEDIRSKLPNKFAIVFDGWTEGTTHYIGISACYSLLGAAVTGDDVVHHTLLLMRPLLITGEESGMTAHDHLLHLSQVLQSYGKSDDNVMICLVGDNCQAG